VSLPPRECIYTMVGHRARQLPAILDQRSLVHDGEQRGRGGERIEAGSGRRNFLTYPFGWNSALKHFVSKIEYGLGAPGVDAAARDPQNPG
jgi:hypothetical protein